MSAEIIKLLEEQKERVPVEAYRKGLEYAIQAIKQANQPKEKPQQQSVDAIAVLKEVRTYFINKRFGQGILNKVVDALDNYEENTLNQDKVREATCDDCEKDAKVDITGVGLYCHEHAKDRI